MKGLFTQQAPGRRCIIATTITIPPFKIASSRGFARTPRQVQDSRDRNQHTSAPVLASTVPPADVGPSTSSAPPKRIAVFVSGGGSNLRAIHAAIQAGTCNAEVVVVVTNAPSCGGAEYALTHGIPVQVYPQSSTTGNGLTAEQLTESLTNVSFYFFVDCYPLLFSCSCSRRLSIDPAPQGKRLFPCVTMTGLRR